MFDEAEVHAREAAALQAADAAERAYRAELAHFAYDFSYSYRVRDRKDRQTDRQTKREQHPAVGPSFVVGDDFDLPI